MRFSIVIPVYNVVEWLPACLDSVLSAARAVDGGVELICVDDGSTDGSGALLDRYAASLSETSSVAMKVLHRVNGGVSAARNAGLDVATGDWLLFVDGDDFVRDTWLADVSWAVDQCDADLIGFGKLPFYGLETWNELPAEYRDLGIEEKICDRLVECCVYQFAYSAKLVGDLRFRPYSVGEDLVFTAAAYARARRCALTDRQEYGYRFREGSATHSAYLPNKMLDVIRFNAEMFSVLSASGKSIGDAFTLGRGREWLETLPKVILAHLGESGWQEVLSAWYDSLSVAANCTCLHPRQRSLARKVGCRRSRFAIWRWCLLPAWWRRKFARKRRRETGR